MGCGLCISVPENSVTPLETWGKFDGFAPPGCNWVGLCTVGGRNLTLATRQTNVKIGTRTKDNVFVTIDLSIQWAVIQDFSDLKPLTMETGDKKKAPVSGKSIKLKDKASAGGGSSDEEEMEHDLEHVDLSKLSKSDFLYRATYKSTNPELQLTSHAEEYFRITVAKHKMDRLFDLGLTITIECSHVLNRAINEYGYLVRKVVIRDILPEDRVRKAMNDIVASQKERDSQITRADADKTTRIKAAEADAEVSRLHGEGIAMQRQAIIGGLRKSVEDFSNATHADTSAVMSLMMMTQHTDMIKESIKEAKGVSLILSASPTSATDLEAQIRSSMGSLQSTAMPSMPARLDDKKKS